jgi:hypothetical protein
MHGLRWRELEYQRTDQGHQGTDNRPGNRRHQGPGSYRQRSFATPAPDPTKVGPRQANERAHKTQENVGVGRRPDRIFTPARRHPKRLGADLKWRFSGLWRSIHVHVLRAVPKRL